MLADVVRADDDDFAQLPADLGEPPAAFGHERHLVDGAEVVGRLVEQPMK